MESDHGKLFIGGISWDTDEERLKEYFCSFGEVVEAIIMRDKITGRARGFGFVIFADPAVADRVITNKHVIDGRTVEAKKAFPKDDRHSLNKSTSSVHSSPGPGRSRKIFVGGLPSTITESDFKQYFDQFGTIVDVVVMYDHSTRRPRGFGFITYDSEDAVDRVLHKTFHELCGKMVEVKRAVPKELSPGPSQSLLLGYNYGLGRANSFYNSLPQGYNGGLIGSFSAGMDGRFNPLATNRSRFSPFGTTSYAVGTNLDPRLSPNYGQTVNFGDLGYERMLSPYFSGIFNRYKSPIGYTGATERNDSVLRSAMGNALGNGNYNNVTNPFNPAGYLGSGSGSYGSSVGERNWGPVSSHSGRNSPSSGSRNIAYDGDDSSHGLGREGYGRYASTGGGRLSSFAASSGSLRDSFEDLYHSEPVYGDTSWHSTIPELDGSGLFDYGLGNMVSDVAIKTSEGFIGNYDMTSRSSNGGIAAQQIHPADFTG